MIDRDTAIFIFGITMYVIGALIGILSIKPACATSSPVVMIASYYGAESGNRTANGERFNPNGLTAAHRTLPFGTRLRVCYHGCVVVRVNDRGPAKWTRRSLDLSRGAARAIGMLGRAVARVTVERVR